MSATRRTGRAFFPTHTKYPDHNGNVRPPPTTRHGQNLTTTCQDVVAQHHIHLLRTWYRLLPTQDGLFETAGVVPLPSRFVAEQMDRILHKR